MFNYKKNQHQQKRNNLPAFYVKIWESLQGSLSGEKFKSALCVPDLFDTEKPHQEVEPIHEESSKVRALWTKGKKLDGFIWVMSEVLEESCLIGQ